LTSFAGSMLMVYFGLCLLDGFHKLDARAWAEGRALLLNWIVIGATLLGMLAQFLLERWKNYLKRHRNEELHLQRAEMELEQRYPRRSWWGKRGAQRQAA